MLLTAVLIRAPQAGLAALNLETGTTTQGETVAEAMANLQQATELYLEEFPLEAGGLRLIKTFKVIIRSAYPGAKT